jgi:hypothetical protein
MQAIQLPFHLLHSIVLFFSSQIVFLVQSSNNFSTEYNWN